MEGPKQQQDLEDEKHDLMDEERHARIHASSNERGHPTVYPIEMGCKGFNTPKDQSNR